MDEKIIKDENGNVIYESHEDGFEERSTYKDNQLIRRITTYPNGLEDLEHYALLKEEE